MEAQTVISVLSDCGDNIEAAIKRLGEMHLQEDARGGSAPESASEQQQAEVSSSQQHAAAEPMPQTSDEWVGKLVQEMSAARDVNEARIRGHRFLNTFGSFVSQDKVALVGKVQELQKENTILKRAVQIQNSKLLERAHQEAEVQQLRVSLGQCQEQVRALEMNNYSLALHLQQATAGAGVDHRLPDVF